MNRKLNILVIDDEQIVLDSVKKHLRKENYALHTVLSAPEGLKLMDDITIDIVLTDLMMPEMDGLELMQKVKERMPHTPVIMITGYATINTALQATQLGAFDYIAKPFTKAELTMIIHRASELVHAADNMETNGNPTPEKKNQSPVRSLTSIGDDSWIMLEDDGIVLLGVERSFMQTIGKIQSVFLPSEGDQLRRGSVYFQIFSTDLRSHTVLTPLSGTVVKVNEKVNIDSSIMMEDPYGEGWLIRLKPSKFEFEIQEMGL
jgi:CheY-like chemotaxis protein